MQLSTQILKPLPSLQHCIDDHAIDVDDKKSDCDDGGDDDSIISTTPFNILFEKMGDILFSFVMGAPCRLFKSKSPTTLCQENKHVLIDKSYDISSVFFFFFWNLCLCQCGPSAIFSGIISAH